METSSFQQVERRFQADGADAALECLVQQLLTEKDYRQLFQARLLQKRFELGLPLIQSSAFESLPPENRAVFEEAFLRAARETGELFLADGDIPGAWPYFRAIGDLAPVRAAIDKVEQHENVAAIIEIAYQEQVHPRKGFELILSQYGVCRAISSVFQYPDPEGRKDCIALLTRTLHADLVQNLKHAIARTESQSPETSSITDLIRGRDWLFGENAYYIDTSHVVSVVQYSLELSDNEALGLALQLAEYGSCLGSMFQRCGNPPLETFQDYRQYLRGVLGIDVEESVAHFRRKIDDCDPLEVGTSPAQVLVGLLSRLGRHSEAIAVSLKHLHDVDPNQLACPSVLQLCQLAGDFNQLREISSQRGDLLSFTAALLQKKQPSTSHGLGNRSGCSTDL